MQHWIVLTFGDARGATHHQEWYPLRPGIRCRVGEFQASYPVGAHDRTEATDAGVGVGREACALLVCGVKDLEAFLVESVDEFEYVIADDSESLGHTELAQPQREVASDGQIVAICHECAPSSWS